MLRSLSSASGPSPLRRYPFPSSLFRPPSLFLSPYPFHHPHPSSSSISSSLRSRWVRCCSSSSSSSGDHDPFGLYKKSPEEASKNKAESLPSPNFEHAGSTNKKASDEQKDDDPFWSFLQKRDEKKANKDEDNKDKENEDDPEEKKKNEDENEDDKDKSKDKDKGKDTDKGSTSPEQLFKQIRKHVEANMIKYVALVTCSSSVILGLLIYSNPFAESITFQEFVSSYLQSGDVDHLEVSRDHHVDVYRSTGGAVATFPIRDTALFDKQLEDAQWDLGIAPENFVDVRYSYYVPISNVLLNVVVPGLAVAFVLRTMFSAGGSIGPRGMISMTNKITQTKSKLKFKDVAGLDEAKEEIMEFVSFLKNPKKYKSLGARIPKGALLVGPPGNGKTLMAKATAGEADVPFYSASGSDFVEMFVGVGSARVRNLFKEARKNAPCIVFIDEIDAIGRARQGSNGNDEKDSTLNQMLVEMDGFNSMDGIIVLAGTNRQDVLDKALTRPGRFDRIVDIGYPDVKARESIFGVHLKPILLDKIEPINLAHKLASLTPGFSGADIANVCNEAALIAARAEKKFVELCDFEAAIERVVGGIEKKSKILAPGEKKTVAYHEAGHCVTGWFLEHSSPLLKVSIVPRGSAALGYAMYNPKERFLYNQEQLHDQMCTTLGGRAAEQIIFGDVSTGAHDDLDKVTKMAYGYVCKYGMDKEVGLVSFQDEQSFEKPYSELTATLIDSRVRMLIDNAYQDTLNILQENREGLEKVARRLMEKEVISYADVKEMLGPKKGEVEEPKEEEVAAEGDKASSEEEHLDVPEESVSPKTDETTKPSP